MKLVDYLTVDRVVKLEGATKTQALGQLIDVLSSREVKVSRGELEKAVWHRESLMSTGIGNGLAIPHVRMAGLVTSSMTVGVSRGGIADYESLDPAAIKIIVLIAAPQGQHEIYLKLLAKVTQVLKHQQRREAIIAAESEQQIYEILTGAEG